MIVFSSCCPLAAFKRGSISKLGPIVAWRLYKIAHFSTRAPASSETGLDRSSNLTQLQQMPFTGNPIKGLNRLSQPVLNLALVEEETATVLEPPFLGGTFSRKLIMP